MLTLTKKSVAALHEESVRERVSRLINRGNFRQAQATAEAWLESNEPTDYRTWFQFGLAGVLNGDFGFHITSLGRMNALGAPRSYIDNWYRDRALALLRGGEVKNAEKMLDSIWRHEPDLSEVAADTMVRARIQLARGNANAAYAEINKAARLICQTAADGQFNATYARNVEWWRMIIALRSGNHGLATAIAASFRANEMDFVGSGTYLWTTNEPRLSRRVIAAAIELLEKHPRLQSAIAERSPN